jgi:hypothetical protein
MSSLSNIGVSFVNTLDGLSSLALDSLIIDGQKVDLDKYVVKQSAIQQLLLIEEPTLPVHLTSKNYVDTAISTRVAKSGDTMTGQLQMSLPFGIAKPLLLDRATAALPGVGVGLQYNIASTHFVSQYGGAEDVSNGFVSFHLRKDGIINDGNRTDGDLWMTPIIATFKPMIRITNNDISGGRVTYFDVNKTLRSSIVTTNELEFLSGVTSNVQTQLNGKLNLTGGTMTGQINMTVTPTIDQHVTTKSFVDYQDGLRVLKTGDTMTGPLTSTIYYCSGFSIDNYVLVSENQQIKESAITTTKLGYLTDVTSNIQSQLNGKLNLTGGTLTGALNLSTLTASNALVLDGAKNIVSSATTSTELGYLSGVTSAVQTQINNKLNLSGGTLTGTATWNMLAGSTGIDLATYDVNLESRVIKNSSGDKTIWLNEGSGASVRVFGGGIEQLRTDSTGIALPQMGSVDGVLYVNGSNLLMKSGITSTKLGYLTDVTSNIQAQLDGCGKLADTQMWTGTNTFFNSAGPIMKITKNTAPSFLFYPQLRFDAGHDALNRSFFKIDCLEEYKQNPFNASMLILNSQFESPVCIQTGSYEGRFCIANEQWDSSKSKILLYDLGTVANPYSIGLSPGWLCLNSPDKIAMCISGKNNTANSKLTIDSSGIATTDIAASNIRLSNGSSLFVGPADASSFRVHHTGTDSYLDYGTNSMTIRRNDGSNNITQAAYIDSTGKWVYAPGGSGFGVERVNVFGGLTLQSSTFDGSNQLRFIHNYPSGPECTQYTAQVGSQYTINWKWGETAILSLFDDKAGQRDAVTRARAYVQYDDFIISHINRITSADLFGVAQDFQLGGVTHFRLYGGRVSSTNGYMAWDLRNGGGMTGGAFYFNSLVWSTVGTITYNQNITHTGVMQQTSAGDATHYYWSGNQAAGSWALQANLGLNTFSFWRFDGANWIRRADMDAGGNLIPLSDEKFKTDILPIKKHRSLERVLRLEPKTYRLIDDPRKKSMIGLIAQEVEKVIPHCVSSSRAVLKVPKQKIDVIDEKEAHVEETEHEHVHEGKSLCYQDLTLHLVNCIQVLHERIKELETKLSMR